MSNHWWLIGVLCVVYWLFIGCFYWLFVLVVFVGCLLVGFYVRSCLFVVYFGLTLSKEALSQGPSCLVGNSQFQSRVALWHLDGTDRAPGCSL